MYFCLIFAFEDKVFLFYIYYGEKRSTRFDKDFKQFGERTQRFEQVP